MCNLGTRVGGSKIPKPNDRMEEPLWRHGDWVLIKLPPATAQSWKGLTLFCWPVSQPRLS